MPLRPSPALVLILLCFFCSILCAQEIPGQYPFASSRTLTTEDIEGKNLSDLKIMRNEIFARHGHTFKSEDLKKHFASQTWYKATTADASARLSPLEKQNIDFIRKWETRISNTSDFDTFFQLFTDAIEKDDANKLADLALIGNFFKSVDDFKESYTREKAQINLKLLGTPRDLGDERRLAYGEIYSQVQYQYVIFKKIGCCWYIESFQKVG